MDVIDVWFIMATLRRGAKTIFQLLIISTGSIKKVFILGDSMAKLCRIGKIREQLTKKIKYMTRLENKKMHLSLP